jgi:hypothetical protein
MRPVVLVVDFLNLFSINRNSVGSFEKRAVQNFEFSWKKSQNFESSLFEGNFQKLFFKVIIIGLSPKYLNLPKSKTVLFP